MFSLKMCNSIYEDKYFKLTFTFFIKFGWENKGNYQNAKCYGVLHATLIKEF